MCACCASMSLQLVESDALWRMRSTMDAQCRPGVPLSRRDWSDRCGGGGAALPLHVGKLQPGEWGGVGWGEGLAAA